MNENESIPADDAYKDLDAGARANPDASLREIKSEQTSHSGIADPGRVFDSAGLNTTSGIVYPSNSPFAPAAARNPVPDPPAGSLEEPPQVPQDEPDPVPGPSDPPAVADAVGSEPGPLQETQNTPADPVVAEASQPEEVPSDLAAEEPTGEFESAEPSSDPAPESDPEPGSDSSAAADEEPLDSAASDEVVADPETPTDS